METVHFSTNNRVGVSLCVDESQSGALGFSRIFQTADPSLARKPETFILRAEERHALMEYLNRTHETTI